MRLLTNIDGETSVEISVEQLQYLRLKAQRLLRSGNRAGEGAAPDSPAEVLEAVCGVQAQDSQAALLSLRARSAGLTADQVLWSDGDPNIVWTWAMRGTLHLISRKDARWLVPFLAPTFIAGDQRRMEQLGWDGKRTGSGLKLLQAILDEYDVLSRREVKKYLEIYHLPFEGQAPVHLLYRAAFECILTGIPEKTNNPRYAAFHDRVGKPQRLVREETLARLAGRYLEAYGPACPEDFASWSGLKISEARQAWNQLDDQIAALTAISPSGSKEQTVWMMKSRLSWLDEPLSASPVVRLLPAYDTFLLGYANRDRIVDRAYARRVHPGGGQIRPVLLVNGQAAGTWKSRQVKTCLEIRVEPFEPLDDALLKHIEAEAADIGRFMQKISRLVLVNPA